MSKQRLTSCKLAAFVQGINRIKITPLFFYRESHTHKRNHFIIVQYARQKIPNTGKSWARPWYIVGINVTGKSERVLSAIENKEQIKVFPIHPLKCIISTVWFFQNLVNYLLQYLHRNFCSLKLIYLKIQGNIFWNICQHLLFNSYTWTSFR